MEDLKIGNTGTQTMKMVHRSDIPKYRKIKYARFACEYRSQKEDANRCSNTVGGYRVEYTGDVSTKTAYLRTIKCLLNSVL